MTPLGSLYDISFPRIYSDCVVAANHQGCFVPRKSLEDRLGFDESLRYAADGKFLDSLLLDHKMITLPEVCFSFVMGGASTLGYRSTLSEIATYREDKPSKLQVLFLRIKTQIRIIIIRYERAFLPYLVLRQKRMLRELDRMNN